MNFDPADPLSSLSTRARTCIAASNEFYAWGKTPCEWRQWKTPDDWKPIETKEDVKKALLEGWLSCKQRNLGKKTLKELCDFAGLDFNAVKKVAKRGLIGPVPVARAKPPAGRKLTPEEIDNLSPGDRVRVTWKGLKDDEHDDVSWDYQIHETGGNCKLVDVGSLKLLAASVEII